MNLPLKYKDLEVFIGKKPVVEYRIKHEKFIGVAQAISIEVGDEIPAFIVDYEWVIRIKVKPLILGATVVASGPVEKRSMRFALPKLINSSDDRLLMKCMGEVVVSMTTTTEELLDALRLKEK